MITSLRAFSFLGPIHQLGAASSDAIKAIEAGLVALTRATIESADTSKS
jgi:hypothetical protein